MQTRLKYLTATRNKTGAVYYYLRRKGKAKIPLGKGPIDSPDFLARYALALGAQPSPATSARQGSIAAVCEALKASRAFLAYSYSYRTHLRRDLDAIAQAYGTGPIAQLEARHIRTDLGKLDAIQARERLKAWRLVCALALSRGWSPISATDGIKAPRAPKSDGHAPWSRADVERFRAHWPVGSSKRLAMELLYWTGARTVDAVAINRGMIGADGVLSFVQHKTTSRAYVPWSCGLPEWAQGFEPDRAHLMACLQPACFTLLEQRGKPMTATALSGQMRRAAKAAGLDLSAHGLRKSRLTAIAESGGSASAIMAWGGHKTLAQAQHYIVTADRRSLISANTLKKSANS